ncbi:MAG: sulfite exporter TauE/SafE family protein [Cyclobacteriaceae bacterium]|nr:sulfite exporter TauE/SafE family protein [Cyclobacteriaceae bacterium]
MITLFSYSLSYTELSIVLLVALFIGMAKTGVHGAGILAVPLLATVFGGHRSSGILLPILVMGDIMGVIYYHRHASWKHLKLLFPWAAVGVVLGTVVGSYINDQIFKMIMGAIIVISVFIMIWIEQGGHQDSVPTNKLFAHGMGIVGGFTSMVGNLAGSVMGIYLLSTRLPKNAYIGTAAWFFMVVNWFKFPFHIFVWRTISVNTVLFDLILLPVILLGGYIGILIIRSLSEKFYRWFIIVMTLVAAMGMIF